jgi:hypothetical protein
VTPSLADVESALHRLFIAREGTSLRKEERQKAREITALLEVVARAAKRVGKDRDLSLVDGAAGKSYVGLLAAELVLTPLGRPARVRAIERDAGRAAAARAAALALDAPRVTIEIVQGEISDPALWPEGPSIAVALHACGRVSDDFLDAAVNAGARQVLLAPCCTGAGVRAEREALAAAEALGIPEHGLVRRSFVESWVAAERTLRLEAAGYETEVLSFVAPTVTPHHFLWYGRRVGEPVRRDASRRRRDRMAGAARR